jgi:glycerol-3-phosphate acyltransferase PlsY
MVVFALMISVAVIITHQKNIERLLGKKESRVNFFNKKSKDEVQVSQANKQ